MGYMVDETSSTLRVINGVPGATNVGRAVGELRIQRAVMSERNDYAIAVTADTSQVVLIRHFSGAAAVSYLCGVDTGVAALALSPDELSVVVYSRDDSRMQVIGGLPSDPAVRRNPVGAWGDP